jgi:MoaA/NifB/PqqE/SkfB family radical SAM enzyme
MTFFPLADVRYLGSISLSANVSKSLAPKRITPLGANVLITENCQARCSTELAIRTIKRLSGAGVRYLRFTGGEPLLRKDLFNILGRTEKVNFKRIRLQTNGLLLKRRALDINSSSITDVTISLDAMHEANDRIRGIDGYYDLAVEGASLLIGKRIMICCTLTGPGADFLEPLIELSESRGWSFALNLLNNRIYKFRGADLDRCWPDSAALEKILDVLRRRLQRPTYELAYIRRHYEDGPSRSFASGEPPCVLGYVNIYITSNGDVWTGCYSLPPLGNLLKDDVKDIVESQRYRKRCLSMLRRECPGCTCNIFISLHAKNTLSWLGNHIGRILTSKRAKRD